MLILLQSMSLYYYNKSFVLPYVFFHYCFRSTIKSLVVLFPLLGITWLFGLLVFATHDVTIQYLFALSNSLQVHLIISFTLNKNLNRATRLESGAGHE